MKTMRNLLLHQITSAESPNRWSKVTSADICAEYLHEFCVYSKFGKSTAFYLKTGDFELHNAENYLKFFVKRWVIIKRRLEVGFWPVHDDYWRLKSYLSPTL